MFEMRSHKNYVLETYLSILVYLSLPLTHPDKQLIRITSDARFLSEEQTALH